MSGRDPFETELSGFRYLVIGEAIGGGGTVEVFGTLGDSEAPTCDAGVFVELDDQVLRVSTRATSQGNERLVVIDLDEDELTVAGPDATATFRSISAVPEAARCGRATLRGDVEFELPLDVSYQGGRLLFDGTSFQIYTWSGGRGIVSVSPNTGSVGEHVPLDDTYGFPLVAEGGAIWASSGSAIGRLEPVPVIIDEVLTGDPFSVGRPMTIYSAAHDGDLLTLFGFGIELGDRRIVQIDEASEPDALVSDAPMALFVDDLAWHDGTLYGLVRLTGNWGVVEVDPETGGCSGTVSFPDELSNWTLHGIASTGNGFWVVGSSLGQLALVDLALP